MAHTFGFFKQNDPVAIVFDDVTTLENTIQITHDFGTITADIPLYVDGVQAKNLEYNPIDGKHYCLIGVAADSSYTISTTDETGSPVTASATTNAAPVKPTPVRVRYVAPGASGIYSEGDPGSFTAAASDEQAGDHIIMEPGTYHEGDLSFSQPVIIEAKDSGNMPVISGFRQTQPSSWTYDAIFDDYSTTDFDVNVKMICWVELGVNQQLPPKADRATLQADEHGWAVVGSTLYLKLPGGLNPNSETLKIPATFQNGLSFFTGASWIENIILEGYGAGASTNNRALRLSGDGDVALNVTVRDNHTDSIRVDSNNAVIDGCTCTMSRDYVRWVEDIKNFVGPSEYLSEGACNIVFSTATKCIVRNCQFTQVADAIIFVGTCQNIDIHDNTLLNVMDESITATGTHKFLNRWGNTLDRTAYWIGYAFAENGPFYFINERCIDTGYILPLDQITKPWVFNLQGTKYNFGGGGTVGMQIAHNCTLDATFGSVGDYDSEYLILFASGFVSGRFDITNCIFSGRDHGFWDASSGGVFASDHNTWWLTEELGSTNRWRYGGVEYPDFATYQAGSGQDADSDFADPQLASGVPSPVIPGKFVPGVTGNAIFGVPLANRGAQ
jgi:hypothetical protein